MDWLGIHYHKNIYLSSKDHLQVFRNCVHPLVGESIMKDILKNYAGTAVTTPAATVSNQVLDGLTESVTTIPSVDRANEIFPVV